MPRHIVTLTEEERQELQSLKQKGGKGYRIKHAPILLKLDQKPENEAWTYDRIKDAYGASRNTIAGVAKRFVMEGLEASLGRKAQENRYRKVTGDVEAKICTIACSDPPEGVSRWTMQAIADELIRLEDVFMISEPLAGRRETVVTQTRTALDFAGILQVHFRYSISEDRKDNPCY